MKLIGIVIKAQSIYTIQGLELQPASISLQIGMIRK